MTLYESLRILRQKDGYNANRLYAQLYFASEYNKAYQLGFDEIIEQQAEFAANLEYPTKEAVSRVEAALKVLSKKIKELKIIAVAHSHIDMNWMWSFDETVSITLSTFRTILDIMNEYPDFTFAQSQASVYKIVEKYDPDMLDEIRSRVKEGRWELSVGSWVETDKNMPSGETLCRHILYAKKYISQLFDVPPESLQLDFEPDTFGHNANVPEILLSGGIKYYYHCRGYKGHHIYRWQSGDKELLCYREPMWYNAGIKAEDFAYMPAFSKKNGIKTLLKVYGIGNHGGGPTRRDIATLIDIASWPLMPNISFGTYKEFYAELEKVRDTFPVVTGELNAAFTGCYTTQTRIKRYNKVCENQLYEAEAFDALCKMSTNKNLSGVKFEEAWERVLFNDFHDILPGSGVVDTREYALGKYQECLAVTTSRKNKALMTLAQEIDVSDCAFQDEDDTRCFGAGAGYCHTSGVYGLPDRNNSGKNRIYHLFNSTAHDYIMPSEITVWDYPGDLSDVDIKALGQNVDYQILDVAPIVYWDHLYQRILVDAKVPAFGYTTLTVTPKEEGEYRFPFPQDPRLSYEHELILENDILKAEFDTVDCSLIRLIDKRSGECVINNKTAYFRFITEDTSEEMTAWRVGRYSKVENLLSGTSLRPESYIKGSLVQKFTYTVDFHSSHLEVTVSLNKGSSYLTYECKCDFFERPVLHQSVPQLGVYIPCDSDDEDCLADIAFGKIKRKRQNMDTPSLGGVSVKNKAGRFFAISGSKYGFRTTNEGIAITLIRGSYDPDPTPDYGVNEFDFAIGIAKDIEHYDKILLQYNHKCTAVSASKRVGTLPQRGSVMDISGAKLSAVKLSENGDGYIFRLYDCKKGSKITLPFEIKKAYICDTNERNISPLSFEGDTLTLPEGKGVLTMRVN